MKSLVLVVLLCGTASARVVMTPTIPRSCPRGATWEHVEKCLAKYGKPHVVRDVGAAKLVHLGASSTGWRIPGFYIYVKDKEWRFGGMYEGSDEFDLEGFQQVTVGKHVVYRFDVAESTRIDVAVSEDQTRPGLLLFKTAVFCSSNQIHCAAIVTACDVFVDGQSRETFRGKPSFKDNIVQNVGDRRHATQSCVTAEEVQLFFDD